MGSTRSWNKSHMCTQNHSHDTFKVALAAFSANGTSFLIGDCGINPPFFEIDGITLILKSKVAKRYLKI